MAGYDYSEHLKTIAWFGETDSEDRSGEYSRQDEREAYTHGRYLRIAVRAREEMEQDFAIEEGL